MSIWHLPVAAAQIESVHRGAKLEHFLSKKVGALRLLKHIYEILEGRRLFMTWSVICGLLFASTNLIPPLLIRNLIKWITEGGADPSALIRMTVLLFGIYIVRGATRYGYGFFSHVTAYRVMHDLMIRVYRHVMRQDVDFISEIIEPMRRCFDALDDTSGYAQFLCEVMPLYDGAHPQVAYARFLHRQHKTDEAIAHISQYLQAEPNWIGFYHLLDLTWSQTRSTLTGPLDSLRQSLGQIIERQSTYHCGQCGFSGRYLHWQCPSCRQWNTIVPVRDVRPVESAPTRSARNA